MTPYEIWSAGTHFVILIVGALNMTTNFVHSMVTTYPMSCGHIGHIACFLRVYVYESYLHTYIKTYFLVLCFLKLCVKFPFLKLSCIMHIIKVIDMRINWPKSVHSHVYNLKTWEWTDQSHQSQFNAIGLV